MDAKKKKRLEAEGWAFGSVQAPLGLSDEEMAYIELRSALALAVRARRVELGLTQTQLAARLESSQGRVARLEVGDSSMDAMVRALLALGVSLAKIGATVARARTPETSAAPAQLERRGRVKARAGKAQLGSAVLRDRNPKRPARRRSAR